MSALFPDDQRHPEGAVYEAYSILQAALDRYRPSHVFGMFSGGHDSLCATHLAASLDAFTAAVHINTGVGVEETREFVRSTCAAHGWPLLEYHPPPFVPPAEKRKPGIDYEGLPAYEALVLHHGFPGPAGHTLVYNRLKERCIRQLVRAHKKRRGERVMLVGGMRQAESVRRMGHAHPISVEGSRLWVAPIVYWTGEDKEAYLQAAGLARNPVVGRLCMSGECLCGAFARPEEMAEIAHAYPDAARYLRSLEARARAAGVHAKWGTRPPALPKKADPRQLHLCWSCEARRQEKPKGEGGAG